MTGPTDCAAVLASTLGTSASTIVKRSPPSTSSGFSSPSTFIRGWLVWALTPLPLATWREYRRTGGRCGKTSMANTLLASVQRSRVAIPRTSAHPSFCRTTLKRSSTLMIFGNSWSQLSLPCRRLRSRIVIPPFATAIPLVYQCVAVSIYLFSFFFLSAM
ncbi:hypothetical protein B0H11DRAFT_2047005 [Mycena galericulata]|nr:hypothetical protein B0H11DRAFT_2047005 [Mycena galericulata]